MYVYLTYNYIFFKQNSPTWYLNFSVEVQIKAKGM